MRITEEIYYFLVVEAGDVGGSNVDSGWFSPSLFITYLAFMMMVGGWCGIERCEINPFEFMII